MKDVDDSKRTEKSKSDVSITIDKILNHFGLKQRKNQEFFTSIGINKSKNHLTSLPWVDQHKDVKMLSKI
jgi:hypothetical protein